MLLAYVFKRNTVAKIYCPDKQIGTWLLVKITRRKIGNWKKLKKEILENNINVQKQPQEVLF